MAFWDQFLSSGIEGAAKGVGTLARDLRAAITGQEAITDQTRIELERIAADLEQGEQNLAAVVNQTMQAEARSEHWMQWAWRPFWGFVSAIAFAFVCLLTCVLGYQGILGGKPEAIAAIPQLVAAFATLFAIPGAILGVTAWHRGKQKRGV